MDIPPSTPLIDLTDRQNFQRTLRQAMKVTLSTISRALPTDDLNLPTEFIHAKQYARYLHRTLARKRKAAVLHGSSRPGAAKHRSRQLHAARRVRGKGGRFLTKEERAELAKEEAAAAKEGRTTTAGEQEEEEEEEMGSEPEED